MGACSSSDCTETLTCPAEGEDVTSDETSAADSVDVTAADQSESGPDDSPGRIDVRSDTSIDAADATDGSDAADVATDDATDVASDRAPDHEAEGSVSDAASEESAAATCQGTCTAVVPSNFQGPVAFVQETGSDGGRAPSPPSCGGTYPIDALDAFANPLFSLPTCQCNCGGVTGASCSSPAVETYTDNNCVNECNQVIVGTCTMDSCSSATQSAKITMPSQPQGGSCPANLQKSVPPWSSTQDWGVTGRACAAASAPPDAGCSATEVCAAVPPAPYGPALCVWQAGNVSCPSTYPVKYLLYTSGSDSRDCTNACSCSGAGGITCFSTVTITSSTMCDGGTATLLTPGSCNMYGSISTPWVSATVSAASGGSCTAGGTATPNGTVTQTGPTTVCCGI
jgi:hypothetical protein